MSSIDNIINKLRENRILTERKDYEEKPRDELIQLAQEGDQLAIKTLLISHDDFIDKMVSKYIMDTADKDDIKQMGRIAFWQAVMDWDMTGEFEAYAGMIIKNKMIDELRKDSTGKVEINTKASSMDEPVADDGEGGEATLGSTIASKDLSPEEEFLGIDGAREIYKFMEENLSDVERDVIKLYIDGWKISQIVEETGMKYKSVENAVHRVKSKLAEYLKNSQRESRRIRESSLEFSDEEKQILTSVLGKINSKKSVTESEDTESSVEEKISSK